jgi:hypothetical protein
MSRIAAGRRRRGERAHASGPRSGMTLWDPEGYMTEIRRSHKVARTQACGDGSMNRPPHVRRVSVLMSESIRSKAVVPAIDAHLAVDLIVEGEPMPVFVWTIDHPAGRVLVDTGMIDARPEADDLSPTPHPENIPRDVAAATASSRACRSASGTRARRRAFAGRLHDPRMGRLRRRDLCRARGRGGAATARSSPSSSGSRTSRSPGGRAPCKQRRSAHGPR